MTCTLRYATGTEPSAPAVSVQPDWSTLPAFILMPAVGGGMDSYQTEVAVPYAWPSDWTGDGEQPTHMIVSMEKQLATYRETHTYANQITALLAYAPQMLMMIEARYEALIAGGGFEPNQIAASEELNEIINLLVNVGSRVVNATEIGA